MQPEMSAQDALAILQVFADNGIPVVVDGGWGVDALLGKQTRKHDDLDIAVEHCYVPLIRKLFAEREYHEVPRDDSSACNFVLGDAQGREIDVHSYTFDAEGNHIYGVAYLPEQLTGTGTIEGQTVRCIPPEAMVEFHTGYPVDDNDFHDVKLLCERFNLAIPDDFEHWTDRK